jgi:hypothetical protein
MLVSTRTYTTSMLNPILIFVLFLLIAGITAYITLSVQVFVLSYTEFWTNPKFEFKKLCLKPIKGFKSNYCEFSFPSRYDAFKLSVKGRKKTKQALEKEKEFNETIKRFDTSKIN